MQKSAQELMSLALALARNGSSSDLPIAAMIFSSSDSLLSSSRNAVLETGLPTAHAELLAIERLGVLALKERGPAMTIVVNLEPCPMCAWAIRSSGIGRLIFGAYNPNYGAAGSVWDLLRDKRYGRPVEVIGGVLEEECGRILEDAFADMRNNGAW